MRARSRIVLPALGLALAILTACGGGGGGGATTPPSPAYTGLNSQATITQANAPALTQAALGGAQAGAVTLARSDQGAPESTLPLAGVMKAMGQLAVRARLGVVANSTPISGSRAGACGGTATLQGSYDETPTSFSAVGVLVADNYCSPAPDGTSVFLTGAMNFHMAGTTQTTYDLTLDTSYIVIRQGASTWIYKLNYRCTYINDVAGTETLTAIYRAPDGKVYQVLDYQVTEVDATHALTISGQFFHPDHGWVNVTTAPGGLVSSFCQNLGTYRPSSGWVKVTGANGTFGEMVPVDCATYQVCYDLNDATGTHCVTESY